MAGRSRFALLTLSFFLLTPLLLPAQVDQADPDPRIRADVQVVPQRPHTVREPIPAPVPVVPIHPTPPGGFGFAEMARAAGMIFSGTVTNIQRRAATGAQALETVAITFRVENAIRGATPGEDLTISQWIGLWSSGQRYRIGQRLVLFLYPRSKLGLTSCVAGSIGRLEIDAWGRILISARHLPVFRTDPVLGGKSRVQFRDFALAVRKASEVE